MDSMSRWESYNSPSGLTASVVPSLVSAWRTSGATDGSDWSRIEVPLLSCGNWGGNGLHLRGNIEGFVRAASELRERRTVTALYCDVLDSVPLGERLDDGELHEADEQIEQPVPRDQRAHVERIDGRFGQNFRHIFKGLHPPVFSLVIGHNTGGHNYGWVCPGISIRRDP